MVNQQNSQISINLETLIQVAYEIFNNNWDYNTATQIVQKKRGLKSIHTVEDHCTRAIGMNTGQFKGLLSNRLKFIDFLIRRYPEHESYILTKLR